MDRIVPMTAFMNPHMDSYKRLGQMKAPVYVSWAKGNRSQLIRIPYAKGEFRRAELRSPDPSSNPYIAFALTIWAALYGLEKGLALPEPRELNLFTASGEDVEGLKMLPSSLEEARAAALKDSFIKKHLPAEIIDIYLKGND